MYLCISNTKQFYLFIEIIVIIQDLRLHIHTLTKHIKSTTIHKRCYSINYF